MVKFRIPSNFENPRHFSDKNEKAFRSERLRSRKINQFQPYDSKIYKLLCDICGFAGKEYMNRRDKETAN